MSLSCDQQLSPLRHAIVNWKRAWLERPRSPAFALFHIDEGKKIDEFSPYDEWKRIGFMRHTAEFWLLARIVLKQIEAALSTKSNAENDLLRNHTSQTSNVSSTVLKKYDETSMSQVNDIITAYQAMHLVF